MDSDGDYYGADDASEEEDDYGFQSDDQDCESKIINSFTVLKEPDLRRRQEETISEVSAVLSVPRVAASILLRHHHWSISELHEAWFADEDRVRKSVGLPESPPQNPDKSQKLIDCGICFESFPRKSITSAPCQHPYCKGCWRSYISTAIESGPGCLTLRCPEPSCTVAIGQDMIDSLVLLKDRRRYAEYLLRSYVEENRKIKWCPAAGCENAVELEEVGDEGFDVSCECSNGFCWNCNEEAHRPVDCSTVAKWVTKNSSEAENTNWILANSKPCPKCKKPIEKNQGCMHMTCRPPCGFRFCWLCLEGLSTHTSSNCNGYNNAGPANEADRIREMAKRSIRKYTHYYERWAANHKSKQKALEDLQKMEKGMLAKLSNSQSVPETQLKFIIEAWLQIVECRRVLKWSYAYGYYLPEEEKGKKEFFEYLQGEAEAGLERLHQCAEKELPNYVNGEGRGDGFGKYRTTLTGLTKVTCTYFENLVRALQNGLKEVNPQEGCSKTVKSNESRKRKKMS